MKLLSISVLASVFCWATAIADPVNRVARQAATSTAPCTVKQVQKKITWNFYLPPMRTVVRPVQDYDLVTDGSGFAWREDNGGDTADHVTRRILFENDQGWTLINCTWKFAAGDPDRNACTSPEFGLLNTPGTNVGDPPPDKGKIGTLKDLRFPALSYWAVYDLLEFRLTPLVPAKFLKEQLTVEIFGWREDASTTTSMSFKIKGSEVGYKVSLPKGWDRIVQWQVRVWWSSGTQETRQDFPFVIDDVIMDEYAVDFTDTDTHCLYPTQTPTVTSPAVTLKFDDIAASPTATLPPLYNSYNFSSDWVVVNEKSYHSGPGSHSASSKPNSLYYSSGPETPITTIAANDFLFDIDSFYLTIDSTATSTNNPANLSLTVDGYGAYDSGGVSTFGTGSHFEISPTSYGFSVDLKAAGFLKQRSVAINVWDSVGGKFVSFWIDDVVVRSWKDGLGGLPGYERCGGGTFVQPWPLRYFCEYPRQQR